ncbi:hypothetical protein I553_1452 [Mycobacterium xenopi 4042]|uniref:Uncharacterized protein n=1 Tax=Mycobacterium xenopi 4042 TaxID=1299334 RepID=X8CGW0_MYCXE|nr:hypothetical protein I553_1452 [Mycobacterium xenopi 4042]
MRTWPPTECGWGGVDRVGSSTPISSSKRAGAPPAGSVPAARGAAYRALGIRSVLGAG